MILAKSEAESKAIFDETLAKIKDMGGDKLAEYQNGNFQRAKQALGQEKAWPGYMK